MWICYHKSCTYRYYKYIHTNYISIHTSIFCIFVHFHMRIHGAHMQWRLDTSNRDNSDLANVPSWMWFDDETGEINGTKVRIYLCVCTYIHIYIYTIWPKTGPFRGVFWMIRFSTFCTKTHFPENQKSWPKAVWELVTWVWFGIPQNITNVRARWVKKTAARFFHSKIETNPP